MTTVMRIGMFETNSSSVHSLVFGDKIDISIDELELPEPPKTPDDDASDAEWDAYYDAQYEYESSNPIQATPDWHPFHSGKHNWTDEELDYTLSSRLAFLCHLGHQADLHHKALLLDAMESLLPELAIEEEFESADDSAGAYVDERAAAHLIDELLESDNLERFIFSNDSTVRSVFTG